MWRGSATRLPGWNLGFRTVIPVLLLAAVTGPDILSGAGQAKTGSDVPIDRPDGLPGAFRDVSLERRCDALTFFLGAYAEKNLKGSGYRALGCGEGSGQGGTGYSFDFSFGEKNGGTATWRIELNESIDRTYQTRLCQADVSPALCSINLPLEPLRFPHGSDRINTEASANAAAQGFLKAHANARNLIPALYAWVGASQMKHLIFDRDYRQFVSGLVSRTAIVPVTVGDRTVGMNLTLMPDQPEAPESGAVDPGSAAPQSFLACFECENSACVRENVRYRFDGRYLALTREKSANGNIQAAGWFMEGPEPMPSSGKTWKFLCGIARYNIQKIR